MVSLNLQEIADIRELILKKEPVGSWMIGGSPIEPFLTKSNLADEILIRAHVSGQISVDCILLAKSRELRRRTVTFSIKGEKLNPKFPLKKEIVKAEQWIMTDEEAVEIIQSILRQRNNVE